AERVKGYPRTRCARLACFMHAASVNPEPGSNSPKIEMSTTPKGRRIDVSTRSHVDPTMRVRGLRGKSSPLFKCQGAGRRLIQKYSARQPVGQATLIFYGSPSTRSRKG